MAHEIENEYWKDKWGGRNDKGHNVRWEYVHERGKGHADLSHKSNVDWYINVIVYLN